MNMWLILFTVENNVCKNGRQTGAYNSEIELAQVKSGVDQWMRCGQVSIRKFIGWQKHEQVQVSSLSIILEGIFFFSDAIREMELEKGVQRWIVDISSWNPSPHCFSFAMSFLPNHEYSSITRFVKSGDQKRALVSRLLQYALVRQVLEIPFDEIIIRRTPEGKPYLVCDDMKLAFPNFNFNASHHGDFVAIASEPICLVGLDIVSHSVPKNETAHEFIQNFSSYFSSSEWYHIMHACSSDEMLHFFYRYWCLKEAFVKAMGTGVGYKLDDVEFNHTNWDDIYVKVAGKELKDWKFWLLDLGQNHSVCIARGHPRTATASYRTTLKRIEFDDKEYYNGLHLPNASFTFRTVEDLIQVIHGADRVPFDISTKCDVSEDEGSERARFVQQ